MVFLSWNGISTIKHRAYHEILAFSILHWSYWFAAFLRNWDKYFQADYKQMYTSDNFLSSTSKYKVTHHILSPLCHQTNKTTSPGHCSRSPETSVSPGMPQCLAPGRSSEKVGYVNIWITFLALFVLTRKVGPNTQRWLYHNFRQQQTIQLLLSQLFSIKNSSL